MIKRRARIFLACPWFDVFAGGSERTFSDLARYFHEYGFEVEVLTTTSKSPYSDWQTEQFAPCEYQRDGITVRRFPVDVELKKHFRALELIGQGKEPGPKLQEDFFLHSIGSLALIEYLKETFDPAVDVVMTGPYYQGLSHQIIRALPWNVILLPAFHDEPEFYWAPVLKMLKSARRVFFYSQLEKNLVTQAYGHELGRKLEDWPVLGLPVEAPKETAPQTALPARDPYVLYVGRLEAGKALPELCKWHVGYANAERRAERTPLKLRIVGAGNEALIPEHPDVLFEGYVSEKEKLSLMRGAKGLANLSRNESFGYVLMEAALQGTPVIVSGDCPVTREFAMSSGAGIPVSRQDNYTKALQALADDEVRNGLGRSGRNWVRDSYNPAKIINRYLEEMGP